MKVYTTQKDAAGNVTLSVFNSIKEFERLYSWVDPRFIAIATSAEFRLGAYTEKHSNGVPEHTDSCARSLVVVYDADRLAAHSLLCEAAAQYRKKK